MTECRHDTESGSGYDSIVDFYRASEYATFDQEHRHGGSFGLTMVDVEQGAIEIIDPAVPDMVFVSSRSTAPMEYDFGDGWRRARIGPAVVDIQPAFQDCALRLPSLSLRGIVAEAKTVAGLLEEVGAAPSALDAVTGQFRELPLTRELVDQLWEAMHRSDAVGSLLADGLFMTFVGQLLDATGHGRLRDAIPGVTDHRIRRTLEYIDAYLDTALSVGELAEIAAMSRSGLARAFRRALGEPIWAYVQRRRVERAKELLEGTALPIVAVAQGCGFASQAHLTRTLRRQLGVTPGAIRRG